MKSGHVCLTILSLAALGTAAQAQGLSVACTTPGGPIARGAVYGYSTQCLAGGGVSPYTWSVAGGTLPTGLALTVMPAPADGAATISGKPTTAGPYNYSVQVTDGSGQTAAQNFSGTIADTICVGLGISNVVESPATFVPSGGTSGIVFIGFSTLGCPWSLAADVPWIAFTSGPTSGTTFGGPFPSQGPKFSVSANPDITPRHGNIIMTENGIFTRSYPIIVNSNACAYAINSSKVAFGAAGGSQLLTVTPTPADCVPMVTTPSWITGNIQSDGTYYYGAFPNFGTPRSGSLQVGPRFGIGSGPNATVGVTQDAGDNSFVVGCVKTAPSQVGSHLATCMAGPGSSSVWSLSNGVLPAGLSVPFLNPQDLGVLAAPGPYDFTLVAKDGSQTPQTASYRLTGMILPGPTGSIGINCSTTFGPLRAGDAYIDTCAPSGGTPPYQWSISAGSAPDGISVTASDTGGGVVVSGSTTAAGTYSYTLHVSDSASPVPQTGSRQFSGTIFPASFTVPSSSSFAVSCSQLGTTQYEAGVAIPPIVCSVTGGSGPYHWSIQSGTLPAGIGLSATTGDTVALAGTPLEPTTNSYVYLKVADSSAVPQSRLWWFVISVSDPLTFNCASSAGPSLVGIPYSNSCSSMGDDFPGQPFVSDGMLPTGLTLSPGQAAGSGVISGVPTTPGTYNFTISVRDDNIPPTIVKQDFTGVIGPLPALVDTSKIAGAMAHLAVADGWNTTTVLVNPSASYAQAHVGFFADDGTPLTVPLAYSPGGVNTIGAVADAIMPSRSVLTVGSSGAASAGLETGSARLSTDGAVTGFIRFSYAPTGQEAIVPLDTRNAGSYILAFDNTNGTATGVAIANVTNATADIPVIIRDNSGAEIAAGNVVLPAGGHGAFVLSDRFAMSANGTGTVEFDTPKGGQISVLGIRYPASGQFTTIPVTSNMDPGNGSMPHFTAGGGWTTTVELINSGGTPANAHLAFFTDDGTPLALPLNVSGIATTAAAVDQSLPAHARVVIDTTNPAASLAQSGSARLTSDGFIGGFIRYRYEPTGQEAISPLETRNASSYILPFDNSNGLTTGCAIANLAQATTAVSVVIRDQTGNQIGSGVIAIPANGHFSQVLVDRFTATANQRGTIEFNTSSAGQISVLGIRFPSPSTFTTIPVAAR